MGILDATVFPVNVPSSNVAANHIIVPAIAGKAIRVWRMILTFDAPHAGEVIVYAPSEDGIPMGTTFFGGKGGGMALSAEQRSWITTDAGGNVGFHVQPNLAIRGSMLAEYINV